MIPPVESTSPTRTETLDRVVVRFAGDSGDGMQVTGNQFTNTAALFGNDISTFPDYPAEIRAPAGSLPGVSGFQINFASLEIDTPGDEPDVLVAMNPAALKVNIADLPKNGILIVNSDSFEDQDLKLAGYKSNPLEDHSLDGYRTIKVPLTTLTRKSLEGLDISRKSVDRCKNFFALGIMYYLYNRSLETTEKWLEKYYAKKPEVIEANRRALRGGFAYCEAVDLFETTYRVEPAKLAPGRYRNISGNTALALGLVSAARQSNLELFLASYPITPASDVLHALSMYKHFGVFSFQAEDEIAAVCAAIGASYGGKLGVTTTSGPGMALKTEGIGLAVMTELPLVVVNMQRGGPSTGLPTKTEQADLFQAVLGRNGESPVPVVSASTPGDCFWAALEAARIAVQFMTPVILLSDGYLANSSEPWPVPRAKDLPSIPVKFCTEAKDFKPYSRDPKTLARPWAVPGTAGLEHRIGGLEKQNETGNVNYEPGNHELMVRLRARKVEGIADFVPEAKVMGPENGKLLVVGWGSTYGAIRSASRRLAEEGLHVSHLHLRYLNPFPRNLGEILGRFERVIVPELNLGQLAFLLRGKYLVDAHSLTKVQGKPFKSSEIAAALRAALKE